MTSPRLALCLFVLACSGGTGPDRLDEAQLAPRDGASYVPDGSWRTASAEQVAIDPAPLNRLTQRMQSGAVPGINALLIVREGYRVVERYFNGSSRGDVHTMQSVSKSVTSLAAGIAADQGKVNANTLVFAVLPEYQDLISADARKGAVSLLHLLHMRAGINFHEFPYSGSRLEAALAPVTLGVATYGGRRSDYGRLFWLFGIDGSGVTSDRDNAIYVGIGNLNQWLFVVPRYDLVVVVTGASNAASPATFFFNEILPAVRPLN